MYNSNQTQNNKRKLDNNNEYDCYINKKRRYDSEIEMFDKLDTHKKNKEEIKIIIYSISYSRERLLEGLGGCVFSN